MAFLQKNGRILCEALLVATLIALSLAWYEMHKAGYYYRAWQVYHYDEGDFRYAAESFWGVLHNFSTYGPEFAGNWGNFMRAIPFRSLGPGTYYLAVRALVQSIHPAWASNDATLGAIIVGSTQCLQIAAYLLFYYACRRKFGVVASLLCLCALLFPPASWSLNESLMAEPFLRILFTLLLSMLLWLPASWKVWQSSLCMLVIILCAQFKPQWSLLGFLMLPGFLACNYWDRLPWRYSAITVLLALAAPAGVMAVNGAGWADYTMTPGSAFHTNHKTPQFMDYICKNPAQELQVFCNRHDNIDVFWTIYMGMDVTPQAYQALDAKSAEYVLRAPSGMIKQFRTALDLTTNFPDPFPRSVMVRLIDAMIWLFLIAGLACRQTLLFSIAGLSLWIIPALGYICEVYDPRYHQLMAGMPLALVCCGIADWVQWYRRQKGIV